MLLFALICAVGFYLLTKRDTLKFKQIAWSIYGAIVLTCIIGLLILKPDTTTYVFWGQVFFLLLVIPVFGLVLRKLWHLSRSTPSWVQYVITIPVSLLFVLTIWVCWNMFPIVMYIF
ncbi:hypothetical protein KUV80_00115 [Fictibacillus nanhaiensis]|uniref:hypothetical protein n=1 Tax=Fictibacillus nanhaiensis TaxID=742169 RepID=UPI001C98386B|nr:hypothetical protein [Fictibacillus nanhaiensis]MBY6035035.1 hypothetical protein [Fictibacillus nanhaiensis]